MAKWSEQASVIWNVLSWSGGHEFEPWSGPVEFGVYSTSVLSLSWTVYVYFKCHTWVLPDVGSQKWLSRDYQHKIILYFESRNKNMFKPSDYQKSGQLIESDSTFVG